MSKNSLLEKVGQQDHKHRRQEKKSKAFEDISKYFSEKQWKNMLYSEKTTCVYLKRNYEIMSGLGFKVSLPAFMNHNNSAINFCGHTSKHVNQRHRRGRNTSCAYSLRERKYVVAYEEISDPEEEEEE
ncbi:protein SSX4, partial [Sorex fumeus]|uniref:protein SSX4 n=1 Tax=Sorex fumeus TaxID=62283 RepID=UPI0024AD5819